MNKIFELVFDLFVAMIILFLSVLVYFGLRTETIVISMGKEGTKEFLEDIKKNAYFTIEDYERYLERLSLMRILCDIQLEHQYTVFEPEYRMRTLEEILAAQKAAYAGTNIYHYRAVETHAPTVSDPIDNSGITMNTQTNASILASATSTGASPGHVHTDDCYDGHVHKGADSKVFTHTHAHAAGSCRAGYIAFYYDMKCSACGQTHRIPAAWYHLDAGGNSIYDSSSPETLRRCNNCRSTDVHQVGSEIPEWAYTCGYCKDITGDGIYDKVPYDVPYTFSSSYPQNNNRASYTSDCYKYHAHKDYRNEIVNSSGGYTSGSRTLMNMVNNGLQNYCVLPSFYIIGMDTKENDNRDFPDSTRIYYSASYTDTEGLRFHFQGYNLLESVINYNRPNPGFKENMSPDEFAYLVSNYQSEYYRLTGSNPASGSSYRSLSFYISDTLNLCNETMNNQWYLACGKEANGRLACKQMVISIIPTNPTQAVFMGEELITTARATYADGSTGVILCTTNFKADATVKNADVTISYTNIKGTVLTAHMTVTVIPRTKTCTNRHTYNLKPDGSDPGCPFCQVYVQSIRIQSPNTSSMTITIGSTLQENGVILLVRYLDGRIETISSGYVDNLDNGYVGTKLVTIGYKGATTSIMVTTVCKKMPCDICGYVYDLNPDGTNPGCPRCISKTPVFTGNILSYENIDYTEDILDDLYEDGIYSCGVNDNFSVKIRNRNSSIARNILRKIYGSIPEQWLTIKQSVSIKDN